MSILNLEVTASHLAPSEPLHALRQLQGSKARLALFTEDNTITFAMMNSCCTAQAADTKCPACATITYP